MKRLLRWRSVVLLLLTSRRSSSAPCDSSRLAVPPAVEDTAGALQLAEALNCSGGSFDVQWVGSVVVEATIRVTEGTSLTISGATGLSSSANGAGRVALFHVDGGTLNLHHLALANAAGIRGGAIYATESVVNAASCTFSNNTAEHGGATFFEGSMSAITHSSFTGNTASEDGGAMYLGSSNVTLGGSVRFESNMASNGGALYLVDGSTAAVTSNNASFAFNAAAVSGGGIWAQHSTVRVPGKAEFVGNNAQFGGATYVDNCFVFFDGDVLFVNNVASDSGGAVSGEHSVIDISGAVVWENNSALVTGGSFTIYETRVHVQRLGKAAFVGNAAEFEGSAYMGSSSLVVDGDIIFANNSGGALYSDLSVINISGNAIWERNQSPEGGGGLLTWKTATHVKLSGRAKFVGNTAAYGGAVYMSTSSLVVDGDMLFANNSGGALNCEFSVIDISGNALWERNQSPEGGGGLLTWETATHVQLSGRAEFVGNTAAYGGAAHMSSSSLVVDGNIYFGNNSVSALNCEFSVVDISGNALWEGNHSPEDYGGGGLAMWKSTMRVHSSGKSVFDGNTAGFGGGADCNNGALVVDGEAIFINNIANHSGGAVDIDYSAFDVTGRVVFEKNIAAVDGGGIASSRSNITIQLTGTVEFRGNGAGSAGAIYLDNDTLSVHGEVLFADNVASYRGGAVNSDHSVFTVTPTGTAAWKNNTSSNQGGGLAMWISTAAFQAGSNTSFSYNSANTGGGISVSEYSDVSFEGLATFVNNNAGSGAGIQMAQFSSARFVGDVTMLGNRASSNGGAMHCESPTLLLLDGVRFVSNYASVNGGAMMTLLVGTQRTAETQAEPAEISNCWFSDNEAGEAAGALFVAGGFISVAGTKFHGNTAGRSGGAVLASGIVTLNNCGFVGNRAGTGSAISTTVSVSISFTDFINNTLLCNDRAFFLDWGSTSAYNSACESCPEDCHNCTVENPNTSQECQPVLGHTASLDAGGSLESLNLQAGFWRSSGTSKDIRECYQTAACSGGTEEYCQTGYQGPFCAVCAGGYTAGLSYTCSKCSADRRDAVIASAGVLLFVFAVAAVALGVKLLRRSGARETQERRLPSRTMEILRTCFKRIMGSPALKIVIVAWQIVSQFSFVASVTYPSIYETFVSHINVVNLNLGWILSAGCLIETNFYDSLLLSTIAPLVILALVAILHLVSSCRSPADDRVARSRIDRRHASILLWVSFLVYSTVSSNIFQTFACDDIDNGMSYLRADHSVECYTPKHSFFMVYAGCMSVVYPFGIPLGYALVLHRHRAVLKSEVDRTAMATDVTAFGELWTMYRPGVYYYEVVECVRRVLLSSVVVFVFPNTAGQIVASFLLALFFAALLLALDPYIDSRDAWVARIGHAIVLMSMFVALLQKVDIEEDNGFSQDVFAIVLVLANGALLMVVGAEAWMMCFVAVKGVTA